MFTPERLLFLLFALSFVVGAVDCFCGNKLGLGARFTAGLQTFAPLFLTMAGFLVLAPMLAKLIAPCARAVFPPLGADPGIFAGLVLANDNGAYPLAKELCLTPEGAGFGGMLVGSVVGVNVICMPLVTQLMTKEDRPFFFKGLMFGMIAMPAGVLAGGEVRITNLDFSDCQGDKAVFDLFRQMGADLDFGDELTIRGGTVLPLGACDCRTDYDYQQDVEFRVYGLKNGDSYTLSIPAAEEGRFVQYTFVNRDGKTQVTTEAKQPFHMI